MSHKRAPQPAAPAARTQAERSEGTRAALVAAARRLFGARGYAAVGTEEIVREAGVTRGALYHHFGGKKDLLAAAFEDVEADLLGRISERALAVGAQDPLAALSVGAESMLEAAADPEVQRIVLLDAPSVLGWERWREIGWRYGMGLTESALEAAMQSGQIPPQAVRPLAHVLLGALDEAALYVARAPDRERARSEMGAALERVLAGLRA